MKRKISVTTGSRSEYGILKPVLYKIKKHPNLKLQLIVAGMHLSKKYGNTVREIENDGFKIDSKINMIPRGNGIFDMTTALGNGITKFAEIFNKSKPNINLILGDRDETLASAVAAYHMNIPNAHIHGGERTKGGIDEYNRHAITKISNIHFAVSKNSEKRIIKMGENPKHVFYTGSPSIDDILANKILSKIKLQKKYGFEFNGKEIILLQHSVTTSANTSNIEIQNTLDAIEKFGKPIIAIYPNSDAGNKEIIMNIEKKSKKLKNMKVYKNIPREDYLSLLKNCGVLVGNSSSGMIEASYFNIPVVNIGIRQQGRERGKNVIDVSNSTINIENGIKKAFKFNRKNSEKIFGSGKASEKIVSKLAQIKLDDKLIQKQIFY